MKAFTRLVCQVLWVNALGWWTAEVIANETNSAHAPAARLEAVRALIEAHSATGDEETLPRAWGLLRPILDTDPPPPEATLAAAWLAQAGHEFALAAHLVERVTTQQPRNADAWLLRANVALVRGDLETARTACRALGAISDALVNVACHARLSLAEGTGAAAYPRLVAVLALAPEHPLFAWAEAIAGDLAFELARPGQALVHYESALSKRPSVQLEASYADTLLLLKEPVAVLERVGSSTALPLDIRRLQALAALGRLAEAAPHVERLNRDFEERIELGDLTHAREMTVFYLDILPDPTLACALASRNLRMQREPEDLRLAARAHCAGRRIEVKSLP